MDSERSKSLVDKSPEEDKNTGPKYRIRWRSQHTGLESGGDPVSFKMIEAVVGRFLTPGTIWCEDGIDHWIEKVPNPKTSNCDLYFLFI